jgi:transcriptional regulator with GAF, ATPase, and Fis domain
MDLAHRGTLFLDEIGELPLAIQAKLLRVLEERRFERVGGTQSIDVDVRIVVATNRNLQQAVADKSFREDLYFRISAVPLTIPPLRERGKDVLLLAEHFLDKFGREFSKQGVHLSEDATNRILEYRWPGNVRELQNAIERAVILSDSSEITADTLQLQSQRPEPQAVPAGMLPADFSWDGTLEEVVVRAVQATERILLENTMRDCRWNKTRAAEKLGISAKTLATKLKSSGLEN